ncbi:hypothetical protein [Ottowia sp. VDI28]|uniref:phage adaptor protein n=1 Tax=Ottowia sp. VDI28 TaxID=3133968 RepID=UPI003C2BDBC0
MTKTEDVIGLFVDAQIQACIRGRLLREDERADVCRIALQAGTQVYKLHESVYEIINLRLLPASGGHSQWIILKSREWLDAEMPDWRDCQETPRFAIQDDTSLRLVGAVQTGDSLALECYRLPMAALCAERDKPEIHVAHHERLVQWVLHRVFSVPDNDLYDPVRSKDAEAEFTAYFGPLPDSDLRRSTRHDTHHHVIGYMA